MGKNARTLRSFGKNVCPTLTQGATRLGAKYMLLWPNAWLLVSVHAYGLAGPSLNLGILNNFKSRNVITKMSRYTQRLKGGGTRQSWTQWKLTL